MAFELTFDTKNAAFDTGGDGDLRGETARILRNVAERIEGGSWDGYVWDLNGNRVGSFNLDEPGASCCNGVGCDECEPEEDEEEEPI